MTSCSKTSAELRRARPLLGTLVEIRARGVAPATLDAAFAAVARVHARMSPHEPASDVARLNRARAGETLRIDAWTWRVLAAAQRLAEKSHGVFDVTIAQSSTGVPPAGCTTAGADACATRAGDWRDLVLLPRPRVRVARPLRLDLGGIAKGFAVDRALAILRAAGATSGVVNAGGDLRVFGAAAERVVVRHPAAPGRLIPLALLRAGALATSANYFDAPRAARLRRPDGRRLWLGRGSVSVRAPTCLLADALTKIVAAIGPRRAEPLLRAHRASALVLTRDGRICTSEEFRDAA